MSLHEHMKPGIYIDETNGDIWRRTSPLAPWTVNGQTWKPFPKALTPLNAIASTPAVSINDAVTQAPEDEWRDIPYYPLYEINKWGKVQYKASKVEAETVEVDESYCYILTKNDGGERVRAVGALMRMAFPEILNHHER